jgi:hypothetical protein
MTSAAVAVFVSAQFAMGFSNATRVVQAAMSRFRYATDATS